MKKLTLILFLFSFLLGYSQNNSNKVKQKVQKTSKTSTVNSENNNPPQPTQANDWNSTRSNKTSKTSRVSNPDGNNNPDPTQANDWNSTRSNKTSKTSRVSNPDGNNNPDPTQANSNQGKDIRKNITISMYSGISAPSSTFKNDGFASNGNFVEFDGAYYFSNFGIGISIGQLSSPTNENFSSSTNTIDLSTTNTTQNWKQFYYGIGPEYKAQFGNFSALFSTKIGLQSVKSINLESNYTNGETPIAILKIKSDKNASLSYFSTGLKFGYNLSSSINLYATANYMAAFSNGITISKGKIADTNRNGIIDAEDLKFATGSATIDYEVSTKTIKPQSTNFGIGLSYSFSSTKSGYDYSHRLTRGRKSGSVILTSDEGEEVMRTGQNPEENDGKIKRKRPGRTKYSNITLERSQTEDNGNDNNTARRGKRKAKKECLKNGGSFWENSNGSYHCMMQLSSAKVGENTNNQLFRSKKRKCFKAGGQWVTNSHGSFCFNPKKQNYKVEVRGWNPKEKSTRKKGYDYYKATNKLDEDSDGDGFLDGLEIFKNTDNDCDDRDSSSLKR
ncbi:hypothetical protein MNBD_BACTEROID04-489, partial [hydrothermal vent metagenome]